MSDEKRICDATGKTVFTSSAAAASRMRRRRSDGYYVGKDGALRRPGARLRAYVCEHCHGWHLSNPEKR